MKGREFSSIGGGGEGKIFLDEGVQRADLDGGDTP